MEQAGKIPKWARGDVISAEHLNRVVDGVNSQIQVHPGAIQVPEKFERDHWRKVKNTNGDYTIPGRSFVQIVEAKESYTEVCRPTSGSLSGRYMVTTQAAIESMEFGDAGIGGPFWVRYGGSAPAIGDTRGPAAGSYTLDAGGTGYLVLGVDTAAGIAKVREVAPGVAFFNHSARLVEANPTATGYDGALDMVHDRVYSPASTTKIAQMLSLASPVSSPGFVAVPFSSAPQLVSPSGFTGWQTSEDYAWAFNLTPQVTVAAYAIWSALDLSTMTWNAAQTIIADGDQALSLGNVAIGSGGGNGTSQNIGATNGNFTAVAHDVGAVFFAGALAAASAGKTLTGIYLEVVASATITVCSTYEVHGAATLEALNPASTVARAFAMGNDFAIVK